MTDTGSAEILPLELGTFEFPGDELPGLQGVVMGYLVRHRGGLLLFDTGFGFGNAELDERYHPKPVRIEDALRIGRGGPGRDRRRRQLPPPRRPLAARTRRFRASRSTCRPPSGRSPTRRTTRSSNGSTSRARSTGSSRATRSCPTTSRCWRRRVTRPATSRSPSEPRKDSSILAGQACYTAAEWAGQETPLEGRSGAPGRRRVRPLDPAAPGPSLSPRSVRPRSGCLDGVTGSAGVSFAGRARRGTSGALYLQSAPAGLNSLPRSPLSNAARRCDVEDRVPRSGEPRTVSGPEGSSTKRSSSSAAVRPGPSRLSWWAREFPGRRRVHGN